jgi:ABC-type branched-subunit amino acid transport system ATPase component
MRLLVVRDVSVAFGGFIASNCVSFDMHKGAILGLIGQNGAGKTTLFNCRSRLYQPSCDDILMDGSSILTRQPHRMPSSSSCGISPRASPRVSRVRCSAYCRFSSSFSHRAAPGRLSQVSANSPGAR